MILITSSVFWICHITWPAFSLAYTVPALVIDANLSAKGLSLTTNTISIFGRYFLALELTS